MNELGARDERQDGHETVEPVGGDGTVVAIVENEEAVFDPDQQQRMVTARRVSTDAEIQAVEREAERAQGLKLDDREVLAVTAVTFDRFGRGRPIILFAPPVGVEAIGDTVIDPGLDET